jgi:signal peptidase II
VLYSLAVGAYVLDRVTKLLVERHLRGRPPIVLIPHVVQLVYTTNTGGAFSVLGGYPWVFFTASLVVSLAIVAASFRLRSTSSAVGLGLILGGALGNLTDRIVHGPGVSGQVTDFIDFHVWPVFNAADSCIVIGALVLIAAGLRRPTGRAVGEGPGGPDGSDIPAGPDAR